MSSAVARNALGFGIGCFLGTLAYFGQHPEEIQLFVPDLQVRWRASQWDDAQVAQVQQAAASRAPERWSDPGQSA